MRTSHIFDFPLGLEAFPHASNRSIDLFNSKEILRVNKTPVMVSSSTPSSSFKHFIFQTKKYVYPRTIDSALHICLVCYAVPSLELVRRLASACLAYTRKTVSELCARISTRRPYIILVR